MRYLQLLLSFVLVLLASKPCRGDLRPHPGDSVITVFQTWSEEPNGYNRTAELRVPPHQDGQKFPLVIDLHGAGGQGNLNRFGHTLGDNVVLLAPNGYDRHWSSKRPDVEFILELIHIVGSTVPSADLDAVTVIGTSNGAAFANTLIIEVPSPHPFLRIIPMYGQLSESRFHDGSFWMSDDWGVHYDVPVVPPTPGPEYMYFHGTMDGTSPYDGGYIHSRNTTLLGAQNTIYIWARNWGEDSPQLLDEEGLELETGLIEYSYLQGKVVHYKCPGAKHNLLTSEYGDTIKHMVKEKVLG